MRYKNRFLRLCVTITLARMLTRVLYMRLQIRTLLDNLEAQKATTRELRQKNAATEGQLEATSSSLTQCKGQLEQARNKHQADSQKHAKGSV